MEEFRIRERSRGYELVAQPRQPVTFTPTAQTGTNSSQLESLIRAEQQIEHDLLDLSSYLSSSQSLPRLQRLNENPHHNPTHRFRHMNTTTASSKNWLDKRMNR